MATKNQMLLQYVISAQDQAARILANQLKTLNAIQQSLGGVQQATNKTAAATQNLFAKMTGANSVSDLLTSTLKSGLSTALNSVVSGISKAISESTKFQNAFLGLGSIAEGTGVGMENATRAAQSLASDGLLTINEAASSLKNLLAKGLNLEQATELILGLKDAAAFGRQGFLEYGQAIVGATEGIRNGLSAMSDNAGVTKNLSIINREAGNVLDDLGGKFKNYADAQKFVNVFLKETSLQTGDAAKLTETYSGQMSRLTAQINLAFAAAGNIITQNEAVKDVIAEVVEVVKELEKWINDNRQAISIYVEEGLKLVLEMFRQTVSYMRSEVLPAFAELERLWVSSTTLINGYLESLGFGKDAVTAMSVATVVFKGVLEAIFKPLTENTKYIKRMADEAYALIAALERLGILKIPAPEITKPEMFDGAKQGKKAIDELTASLEASKKAMDAGAAAAKKAYSTSTAGIAEQVAEANKKYHKEVDGVSKALSLAIKKMDITGKTTKEIANDFEISENSVKRFKQSMEDLEKTGPQSIIKSYREELKKFVTEINLADKALDDFQLMDAFGKEAAGKADKARLIPGELEKLPAIVKKLAEEWKAVEFNVKAEELKEATRKAQRELEKLGEQAAVTAMKQAEELFQTSVDFENQLVAQQRTGASKMLGAIEDEQREALKKLGDAPRGLEKEWKQSRDRIIAYFADLKKEAQAATGDIVRDAELRGIKTKEVVEAQFAAEKGFLAAMVASGKFTQAQIEAQRQVVECLENELDTTIKWRKELEKIDAIVMGIGNVLNSMGISGLNHISEAFQKASQASDKLLDTMKQFKSGKWMEGIASGLQAATGAIDAMKQATSSRSQGKNVLGGAATGARIGAAFGPWGAAIGAAAGALIGFFRGAQMRKATQEVADRFGVQISEALAKEITEVAKTLEGGTKDQRRQRAELLSLNKIIEEAGGVTGQNIEKFAKQAKGLFEEIQRGGKSGKAALEQLNNVFGEMVSFMESDLRGIVTPAMLDFMKAAKSTGVEVKAITEFLKQMADVALEAVGSVVSGFTTRFTSVVEVTDQINELAEKRRDLIEEMSKEKKGTAEWERLNRELQKLDQQFDKLKAKAEGLKNQLGNAATSSQERFDRLSRLLSVTFESALQSGKTFAEALQMIAPGLQQMKEAAELAGFQISETLQHLISLSDWATNNPELADSIAGLNSLMKGLANQGAITQQVFTDLGNEAVAQFQDLVDSGLSTDDAFKMMQPTLQTLYELQQRFNFALDETTQKLLDEAAQAGVVGDAHKTAAERMVDGINKVVDRLDLLLNKFGVQVPNAVSGAAGSIINNTNKIANSTGAIADAADGAVYAFHRLGDAAQEAGNAAYEANSGVVYGNSPGGLDDMISHLDDAINHYYNLGDVATEVTEGMVAQMAKFSDILSDLDTQIVEETLDGVALQLFQLDKQRMSMINSFLEDMNGASQEMIDAGLNKINTLFDLRANKVNAAERERQQREAEKSAESIKKTVQTLVPTIEFLGAGTFRIQNATIKQFDVMNSMLGKQKQLFVSWSDVASKSAMNVYDAVTAVALGQSPGGIKEIPVQIEKALASARLLRKVYEAEMDRIKVAVDTTSSAINDMGGDPMMKGGPFPNEPTIRTQAELDREMQRIMDYWNDPNRIRHFEEKVPVHVELKTNSGVLIDEMVEGVRLNTNGSRSKLKKVLS